MLPRFPLLFILLLLSGLLLAAASAHGAESESSPAPLTFEEPLEEEAEDEEGEEEEESECETAEEEVEEGELAQAEADEICKEEASERRKKTGPHATAPEECVLRSAHAHASTLGNDNKLKLTLGYTTYEPVAATIRVGHLTTLHRHLGRSGVIRVVEPLRSRVTNRVTVRIDVPKSPRYCGKYLIQRIAVH